MHGGGAAGFLREKKKKKKYGRHMKRTGPSRNSDETSSILPGLCKGGHGHERGWDAKRRGGT